MNGKPLDDTIAAVATPIGQAGIGIIRLSGPRALEIAKRIFIPRKKTQHLKSHRLYLGSLVDPRSGAMIDEVLLSYMKAPRSYTREDVVEINSHSGFLLLSRILEIVLQEGARPADPGEFTFRAFMNGRIDLTQAEAVVDLIHSRSQRGLQLASQQIAGRLGEKISAFRRILIDILARIEVAVDFPEEEDALLDREETARKMEWDILHPMEEIMTAHQQRKVWMEGLRTVLVGRVNVGKSSLLNRLLNEEKAIVTPIPGTTRDIIESTLYIDGIPLRLMDTAGFRKVQGEVERLGIRMAERKLAEADLSLIVLDRSRPLAPEDLDILARADKKKSLVILNKIDLPPRIEEKKVLDLVEDVPLVKVSALTGHGINQLQKAVRDRVLSGETDTSTSPIAPNLRQKNALEEASVYFKRAIKVLKEGLPLDLVAVEIQGGMEALGAIIGETAPEEILDRIFSRFCIGK
ncbi:MAG: tRNA uridine-5-carboxymethylaminomethyl(34) synthesis GTPase MnmE [Deltaproteobacteria bacterium]|nr:tRNA uridine-5-carboxymethylaminomethyl(34) synthesis GTPase MnmE [Deltaproteobacteria bacterium]MBW2304388.1 tRNA uridine-5-carboxymethylaminomethyl(34) synthesis GTPase MnmE [Deltaproteobacteria bacterium]